MNPEKKVIARELKRQGLAIYKIMERLEISRTTCQKWTKDIPNISMHSLSSIDLVNRTAECTKCKKTVKIQHNSKGTWRCANYRKPGREAAKTGNCEICGKDDKLKWDHCHKSSDFRGWLCHNCNIGLGFFKDNSVALRKAASYLDKA